MYTLTVWCKWLLSMGRVGSAGNDGKAGIDGVRGARRRGYLCTRVLRPAVDGREPPSPSPTSAPPLSALRPVLPPPPLC